MTKDDEKNGDRERPDEAGRKSPKEPDPNFATEGDGQIRASLQHSPASTEENGQDIKSGFRRGLRRTEEEWQAKKEARRSAAAITPPKELRGLRKNQRPVGTSVHHTTSSEPSIIVEPSSASDIIASSGEDQGADATTV